MCSGVSSFITNNGQWCVFVYQQWMGSGVSPLVMKGVKNQKDPDIIIAWSVNTTTLFRNHTRCFSSLHPSAGAHKLEIYRRRNNWEVRTQREEEATRASEEFGGWRLMAQKGGGGWDLDVLARKSNNKSYVIKQYGQCSDVRG